MSSILQYSNSGLTAHAKLLGNVQGVVVQTSNLTLESDNNGKVT